MIFVQGRCPITHLPVTQRPEWADVFFGGNYRVSYWLIGDHILLTRAHGGPDAKGMTRAIAFNRAIEDHYFSNGRPYIRIEDWSDLKGADQKARELYLNFILNNPRIRALVYFNLLTPLKVAIKIASKFKRLPFPVEIAEDYHGAIKKAKGIWAHLAPVEETADEGREKTAEDHTGPVMPETADLDQAWEFRKDDYHLKYTLFDGNILHGLSSGIYKVDYIEPTRLLTEKAVLHIKSSGTAYYFILNLKGMGGVSQRTRKNYAMSLIRFYRQYPFEKIIFYGVNTLLKTAINLAGPFVPFNVRITDSLDQALELVKRDKEKKSSPTTQTDTIKKPARSGQTQKYVYDILQYLDQIEWGEENEQERARADLTHPFHRVFETLDLLRWEYNDLLRERTLVEEDLRKSKEESEKANRAKSEFLANMSHELRTPLNHIIGFSELLSDQHFGPLNSTQSEYLNDILHSSRHLLSLINDILDLSKVEAGKMALELSSVPLRPLLDHSLVMIKEKALKHRILIETVYGDLPETVRIDERKTKQIIFNLLSNAVKFTPDGGKITLSAFPMGGRENLYASPGGNDEEGQGFIQIGIQDTGIGITDADLEKIFKPFEQADTSSRRRYHGTGLGLSLTRSLVELQGGTIWAESPGLGKGSTFCFIIPRN
jgi:signal transduction histidine kinase